MSPKPLALLQLGLVFGFECCLALAEYTADLNRVHFGLGGPWDCVSFLGLNFYI